MERLRQKTLNFSVAFDEADGEGIVFFGNYFRLAHRALEQYLPLLGINWEEWFANPEWGVPLRHVEADYLQPLRAGEAYCVTVDVAEIGESSVHFSYQFLKKDGAVAARVRTSHVFVGRKEFQKIQVPQSIRSRLGKQ